VSGFAAIVRHATAIAGEPSGRNRPVDAGAALEQNLANRHFAATARNGFLQWRAGFPAR